MESRKLPYKWRSKAMESRKLPYKWATKLWNHVHSIRRMRGTCVKSVHSIAKSYKARLGITWPPWGVPEGGQKRVKMTKEGPGGFHGGKVWNYLSKMKGFGKKTANSLSKSDDWWMEVSPRGRPGRVFRESGALFIFMKIVFRVWQKWQMHHARILEASGLASWKNWARTPDKNRVFCKVEHSAAELDAQSMVWL